MGYGSKQNHQGTAGFSFWFHLPGFHFWVPILTHCQLNWAVNLGDRLCFKFGNEPQGYILGRRVRQVIPQPCGSFLFSRFRPVTAPGPPPSAAASARSRVFLRGVRCERSKEPMVKMLGGSTVQLGQHPLYHFGVGEFSTRFRTYFSGDWDVHWGYFLWCMLPRDVRTLTFANQ